LKTGTKANPFQKYKMKESQLLFYEGHLLTALKEGEKDYAEEVRNKIEEIKNDMGKLESQF
jgi:hypothetical protein